MSFRCGRHAASVMYGPRPAIGIARTVCFHVNEQPRFQNVTEFSPIVARSGALVRSSLGPIVPADLLATAEALPGGRCCGRLRDCWMPHHVTANLHAAVHGCRRMRISRELIFVSTLELQGPSSNRCIENVEFRVDVVKVMTSWWNWPRACSISGPPSRRAPQSTMEPNHLA